MGRCDDERELRALMARYVDAANRRDGAAWAQTWAADGRWIIAGMEVTGRDAILELWRQVIAGFEFALLMPASSLLRVDGDVASGHWYLQEFTRDLGGECTLALGRYLDTYSRREGQWLFQSRQYDFIYRGPADLSGDHTPLPAAH